MSDQSFGVEAGGLPTMQALSGLRAIVWTIGAGLIVMLAGSDWDDAVTAAACRT
jgi:hypothetical protein